MSGYLTGRALWADLPLALKLTLVILTDAATDQGVCYPGHERIARQLGVSERQVRRNLAELQERGFIDWTHRQGEKGYRTSSRYQVNLEMLPHPPGKAPKRTPASGRTAEREDLPHEEPTGHGRPVGNGEDAENPRNPGLCEDRDTPTGHGCPVGNPTGHLASSNRTSGVVQPDIAMSGEPSVRTVCRNQERERARSSTGQADTMPLGIPVEAWQTFVEHRAEMGRPLTDLAARTIWKRLLELPEASRVPALESAVVRGLREPCYDARPPPSSESVRPKTAIQRAEAEYERIYGTKTGTTTTPTDDPPLPGADAVALPGSRAGSR